MSVLIQTSFGDITIDLWVQKCPQATLNLIKLCKIKHYNNALFIEVQKNHISRVLPNNPTTIWQSIGNKEKKYFNDQIDHELKFNDIGYIATSNTGPNLNNSGFFITLTKSQLSSLKGKHTVFGKVQEGLDVLRKINDSYCDKNNRPQMNIRILHTHILYDPFQDLQGMNIPSTPQLEKDPTRLQAIQHLQMLQKYQKEEDIEQNIRRQKAKKQAITLEMLGDLPDANIKPPQNVLFVCKLNPITQQRDLQIIFSRFGPIKSVQIVRDWKTGQSLQYAFIQFQNSTFCQQAYLKMNNVLIDDRRIQVDFSQSVSKLMPKNRKPNQPPQRIVKQQQIVDKKQKIVMANKMRNQNDLKYSLITSKPNYHEKRQYQQKQFIKEDYNKKIQNIHKNNQFLSSESSSSIQRKEKKQKKKEHKKKQKKQNKKQKKNRKQHSRQSRDRSRSKKYKIQKKQKKQKKQHKRKHSSSSESN